MRAGTLDRTVTIERSAETLDDYGAPSSTWSAVATLRAALVEQTTGETTAAAGAVTTRKITLRTRFHDAPRPGDRVSLDGLIYELKDVAEIGRRRGLELRAERSGP